MTDIFISYASADRSSASILADDLAGLGYTVWWDTHLIAGESFREAIFQRLDAARAVVVIWTQTSIRSDWVIAEADRGYEQKKLIPVRVSTLSVKSIPPPFGANQHIIAIDNRAALMEALALRLRTSPQHQIADRTRDIYRQWGSTSWGPKPEEIEQIIQAFRPNHQIEMADRLASFNLNSKSAAVDLMQGWWMLSRLVQAILALFLTAHDASFKLTLAKLDMRADILPVGLSLIALLNFVAMEEIFSVDDRGMLNQILLVSEEARLSSIEKSYDKAETLDAALDWYPGFLGRLQAQLPELRHESEFYDFEPAD